MSYIPERDDVYDIEAPIAELLEKIEPVRSAMMNLLRLGQATEVRSIQISNTVRDLVALELQLMELVR